MAESVIIIGAGVAGLTAAHELVERGFQVTVYDRRDYVGGKAASVQTSDHGLPGEHGFRFFPSWYKHLPDTMRRIPYKGRSPYYSGRSVYDNLVTIDSGLLAWCGRDPIELPMHMPRSMAEAAVAGTFIARANSIGLARGELGFFARKVVDFALVPEAQREQTFDSITWWDYVEASTKSRAYQDFIQGTSRTLVAARAKEASAYTIGRIAIRTFLDALSNVDRVLNGPTSDVWLRPWQMYLRRRGVKFELGVELESLEFDSKDATAPRVSTVVLSKVKLRHARRLHRTINLIRWANAAFYGQQASAQDKSRAQTMLEESIASAKTLIANSEIGKNQFADAQVLDAIRAWTAAAGPALNDESLKTLQRALVEIIAEPALRVTSDHVLFALPVEQLAYYINRSAMLTQLDPSLQRVVKLAAHTDWMAGIQFYMKEAADIGRGHLVAMDSEWSVTAIEHTQFWRDFPQWSVREQSESAAPVACEVHVKSIISVDISSWDKKGRAIRKVAANCTSDEIAKEVWEELKAALNRPSHPPRLRDDMLIKVRKCDVFPYAYHLDDNIAERFDRKKQAALEKAAGLVASGAEDVDESLRESEQPGPVDYSFAWGPRLNFNIEPLLVNHVGTRSLRPEAQTRISNMFLAGDYAKTETDLACMEAANEAARRAVNALLDAAGSRHPRCELWTFSVPENAAKWTSHLRSSGDVKELTSSAAQLAGKVATGFFGLAGELGGALLTRRPK